MNLVHLYLSAGQRESCLRALNMAQRWTQGDVGVFAELADAGFLRNKDGKNLSLSQWSTIVEPALTDYASLAAGTTPGVILDVHDPGVHPLGAACLQLQQQWAAAKTSKKYTTLAALPDDIEVQRTDTDAFNVYKRDDKGARKLDAAGLSAKNVAALGQVHGAVFKLSIEHAQVHTLIRVLDIYSRILMNQWEYIKELTDDRWDHRRNDWHERVEEAVKSFKEPWTGYSVNASSGIHGQNIHPDAMVVWTVQKAVRHWEMVQRLGYSHRGVSSDAPMSGDSWPLVDGDASADLLTLPVGGGVLKQKDTFYAVQAYTADGAQTGPALASSYSPVSLLDSLAYTQANPGKAPTF